MHRESKTMASEKADDGVVDLLYFNDPATPEKMKEIAKKELGETEEVKRRCLQQLRDLITEHDVTTLTTDEFLLRFLRTKKFRLQKSFEAVRNYSRIRASFHDRLMSLDPKIVETVFSRNVIGILPYRDARERIIIFLDTGAWNPSICSDAEFAMIIIILINFIGEKLSSQISGFTVIYDCTVIPVAHIPYLMRQINFLLDFAFKCVPARYGAIHFLNQPPLLKVILFLVDRLLPKKIKDRLILHGKTRDVLFQYFSHSMLPDEYGGTLGPLSNNHVVQILVDHFQEMKDQQKYFLPEDF